jgi:hypothetical protein
LHHVPDKFLPFGRPHRRDSGKILLCAYVTGEELIQRQSHALHEVTVCRRRSRSDWQFRGAGEYLAVAVSADDAEQFAVQLDDKLDFRALPVRRSLPFQRRHAATDCG